MSQSVNTQEPLYSSLGGDEDLGEIVTMFVEEMPDRIQNLIDLCENEQQEELRTSAHQLKGAAGSYGFDQLTPFAARLEKGARGNAASEEIREALDELVAMCGRVRSGTPD